MTFDLRLGGFGLCGLLLLSSGALAHGGQYRGPGCTLPPSPGANGSPSTGTSGSGSQTSGGGSTPSGPLSPAASNTGPASGSASKAAARGVQIDDDLTRWEFWWEFGKDPFLRLRDAVHGGRAVPTDDALLNPRLASRLRNVEVPTDVDLTRVANRLVGLLAQDTSRDTTSAGLIALAKIGRDGDGWRLVEVLLPYLQRNDQEIRETAALALGISGIVETETIGVLAALVADDDTGRQLSGGSHTNERTRAFAAFGLGLLLRRTNDAGSARRIVDALLPPLAAAHTGRDLQVAVIEALSLFPRTWESAAANVLRDAVVESLGAFYERPLGPGAQLVQAHVPPALARLLRATDPAAARWRARFASDLTDQLQKTSGSGKLNPHIAQSCALALGPLTPAWAAPDDDASPIGLLLLRTYRQHKDHQTRRFALLSLGRMGGAVARERLLREFDEAGRALEQPWVAMALGVLVAPSRSRVNAAAAEVDVEIAEHLRNALVAARNPSAQAGLAIALGLLGDREAGDHMRDLLRTKSHQDELAGYLCIGLGLMRDDLAAGDIRALMAASSRRPHVVFHCAQALGLLGDPSVTGVLCRELETKEPSLARLSAAASALGQIGDRRSLEPLLRMLSRDEITPLTRAFAVVGLGNVCDKDPLPWNTAYATDCNYRASTSTLTDGASGILDIL